MTSRLSDPGDWLVEEAEVLIGENGALFDDSVTAALHGRLRTACEKKLESSEMFAAHFWKFCVLRSLDHSITRSLHRS